MYSAIPCDAQHPGTDYSYLLSKIHSGPTLDGACAASRFNHFDHPPSVVQCTYTTAREHIVEANDTTGRPYSAIKYKMADRL